MRANPCFTRGPSIDQDPTGWRTISELGEDERNASADGKHVCCVAQRREIEHFLSAHPDILDVAVIGLPDKRLGEICAAIIQLKPGRECTEEQINEFCIKLPRYKRPRKIIFADVPRNPTGKIEKPKLREIYGSTNLVDAQNKG